MPGKLFLDEEDSLLRILIVNESTCGCLTWESFIRLLWKTFQFFFNTLPPTLSGLVNDDDILMGNEWNLCG